MTCRFHICIRGLIWPVIEGNRLDYSKPQNFSLAENLSVGEMEFCFQLVKAMAWDRLIRLMTTLLDTKWFNTIECYGIPKNCVSWPNFLVLGMGILFIQVDQSWVELC